MMEKLLAIVSLSQNIYGKWLFPRVVSGILLLVSLTIITSIMVSALLIGGFYAIYVVMVHAAYSPQIAMFTVGIAGLITTLILVYVTLSALSTLRQMPRAMLRKKAPQVSQVTDAVHAFLEGFLGS